jgi:hypothetical protein
MPPRSATLTLTLLLVILWSVSHHYLGLGGDARLYAVQALARIHPNLLNDLYLRNTSQDSYTIFSGSYATCIRLIGLRNTALVFTVIFKVWFFAAAWFVVRRLSNSYCAFLAVALLIVTGCAYGAFGVFHYAEDWLTARSVAEALMVTALACYFYGRRFFGLLIACIALFVHPLMALPGLLLLICLWLPLRLGALLMGAGVVLCLAISLGALYQPSITHFFALMDATWLMVVRERSQFLFLQLWRTADWSLNARPFLSLFVSALVIGDSRVRKLCAASTLVGASGLAVALIASLIGPVNFILQGQAWRWVWLTALSSVLLLAPTFVGMARSEKTGLLCVVLMICGWVISPIGGVTCLACVLVLWLARNRVNFGIESVLRGVAIPSSLDVLALTGALAWWTRSIRSTKAIAIAAGLLGAAALFCLPRALQDNNKDWAALESDDFSDWRRVIPANANVFVVPAHNSAAFSWFTLERPSYLTVDQSSGVVFSRATALEVVRRSQVLLPLMQPDWKILSNAAKTSGVKRETHNSVRALTGERLMSLCQDPQLNFIVARENLPFEAVRHTHAGNWKDWNLYDCRSVQSAVSKRTNTEALNK